MQSDPRGHVWPTTTRTHHTSPRKTYTRYNKNNTRPPGNNWRYVVRGHERALRPLKYCRCPALGNCLPKKFLGSRTRRDIFYCRNIAPPASLPVPASVTRIKYRKIRPGRKNVRAYSPRSSTISLVSSMLLLLIDYCFFVIF